MTLLLPLGLLGLLGIAALIVIYIIRPNYQTQHIPSSYVWQLSLKYRRRRIPTSRLRNILIFLCQVFILLLMAAILSMPALVVRNREDSTDVIAIIDSSASMYAGNGDIRFNRAVDGVMDLADETFANGGYMSVILADDEPRYLAKRFPASLSLELHDVLQDLIDSDACSYSSADIDGALALSEEVLAENNTASIYIYTDTQYEYVPDEDEGIKVVPIGTEDEWNAAILDAYTELEDGYYSLTVEVACYGMDKQVDLTVEINGANASDASSDDGAPPRRFNLTVPCEGNETKTVVFCSGGADGRESDDILYFDLSNDERFYSYRSVHIYLSENDCFSVDNSFDIYGGQKEVLKIQYASSDPNIFFNGALYTLLNAYSDFWDIRITDVKKGTRPALEGFDLYIFEHKMPDVIPSDGIVFLVDPDIAPVGSGITVREVYDLQGESVSLSGGDSHPLLRDVLADHITVSRYTMITLDEQFDVLMSCDGWPVLAAAKDGSRQIAVMAFSGHYSNFFVLPEYVLFLMNMVDYYLPATVNGNSFEVGEDIELNSRGPSLTFSGAEEPFSEFPAKVTADIPGTYTIEQTSYFDKQPQPVQIFVRIPRVESDTQRVEGTLEAPVRDTEGIFSYEDLLIYLAAALVFLLFAEWWLQARENK